MREEDGAPDLWAMVYGSAGFVPFVGADLRAALEASRSNKARLGVSGVLVYRDGNLLQVLEGAERAVHDVYRGIRADRRHLGCQTFLKRRASGRMFDGWTVALSADAGPRPSTGALDRLFREAREPGADNARAVAKLVEVFLRIMT
jgi:hypothetical protein